MSTINFGDQKFIENGKEIPIQFTDFIEVTTGVHCGTFIFPNDPSRDIAAIWIEPGCTTPLQLVKQGTKTVEGTIYGEGKLIIRHPSGSYEVFKFDEQEGSQFAVHVEVNDLMQWEAAADSPLMAYEICEPPFEPGRYFDFPFSEFEPQADAMMSYTNWQGETGDRRIRPSHLWYGSTEWHPEPQWLLHALDLDKNAERDFAVKDIKSWQKVVTDVA